MFNAQYSSTELKVEEGFLLGELRVEPASGIITGPAGREQVDPKVMEVLMALARRPGEPITREELLEAVWPGRIVCDETLTQCVYQLRGHLEAAGGDARFRELVSTLPKRGYRLDGKPRHADPAAEEDRFRPRTRWRTASLSAVLVALSGAWWLLIPSDRGTLHDAPGSSDVALSIAVLPFADMSPAGDQEYFADGLAEEIIHLLAQIESLKVIGRTSSFAFKDKDAGIPQIGKMLGVNHILEGSVRKSGDRLRITAQLVKAGDGSHLWSETYDRQLRDIFEIQTDVALHIADALQAEITPAERARLAREPTDSLEAHTLYLKGRYFWNQRTGQGLARAKEYFEQAIAADPDYARAYAGLASVFGPLGVFGYAHPSEAQPRMHEAARRAVELDDELAEAHLVLATYLGIHAWKWAEAEKEYSRAIELDPDFSRIHPFYRYFLEARGRIDEAVKFGLLAVELEPLVPIHYSLLADSLLAQGRLDSAAERYRQALELNPGFWLAHEGLGKLHELRGELEEAIQAFKRAGQYAGPIARPKAGLARVLALAGGEEEARRIVDELRAETERNDIYTPQVATALYALGDADAAFEWLEAAYRQRNDNLQHIALESGASGLQEDTRFRELLQRMGLEM